MRGLSPDFMKSLTSKSGLLNPILERVKIDDTLMLAIRDEYINIYYRGGNIIRIKANPAPTSFIFDFDEKYSLSESKELFNNLGLNQKVTTTDQVKAWITLIPQLKELMDFWFNKNSKMEREFQQLVVRENNSSSISGTTEYFITDIEFADSQEKFRFDALAIKWPALNRKDGNKCI
ncbi:MAG TPA: hypothetical protein PK200_14090, partial [Spirochaetota bacterium]|nr:hypothetical protein [Spirochaetota bacterium]